MEIVFATNNKHKLHEIKSMLTGAIKVLSLEEVGIVEDIEETGSTLEENAKIKSLFVYKTTGKNCFADDTGLETLALNNEPGVYSARYAGDEKDSNKNIDKLLQKLHTITDRRARFKTVISLYIDKKEYQFEGIVNGTIRTERSGDKGFGYDPVFQPDGYDITFAEMPLEEKNKISHRGNAFRKLVEFLNNYSS